MIEAFCEVSAELVRDLEAVYPGLLSYDLIEFNDERQRWTMLIKDEEIPPELDGKFIKFQIVRRLNQESDGTAVTILWKEADTEVIRHAI